ncbi:MAG: hypothetical protein IPH75_11795 [bacterium]|nr:hypothetical protein [bacterium]
MKVLLIFITGLLTLFIFGCSDSNVTAPSSNPPASSPDLPAKANQMVALYGASDDGTLPISMAVTARQELESFLADTSYDVYAVTMLWGSFTTPDNAPGITVDWSGSMKVNGVGEMGVISALDFEGGIDSLLPGNDPMTIAWRSFTQSDIDGMVSFIAMKRGIFYVTAPTLKVQTAPVSVEVVVDNLTHFQAFYPTGNLSGMAIFARKLKTLHCPHGSFNGHWTRADETHMSGTFGGIWRAEGANTSATPEIGTLEGSFWVGDAQNLFAGNWLDASGTLVGHLKGTWSYTDYAMCPVCGTRYGQFEGEIFDLAGHVVGSLKGGFGEVTIATPTPAPLALSMVGNFRFHCPSSNDTDIADD